MKEDNLPTTNVRICKKVRDRLSVALNGTGVKSSQVVSIAVGKWLDENEGTIRDLLA